ncbi:hypothetical protein JGZ30_10835 [Staphylococcus pseudintermedius]|uniref:hypothetical protein n=1 Tax=Staphylococcus pseudintermedius TaxID=283734 RepID=UPI0018F68F64|nr:hypothetical protein [Staphylococcus pseudintermedius]MBJ8294471.1 hypothetical protein [Staphylococcus pseudintermedius]
MKKELDYEKLNRIKADIIETAKNIKVPDVEDGPFETFESTEGFDDLTDEEIRYLAFGIKPD